MERGVNEFVEVMGVNCADVIEVGSKRKCWTATGNTKAEMLRKREVSYEGEDGV